MTTKEQIIKVLEQLPEDASIEDAMERLYILYKVERGIRQADAGLKVSHEVARERIKRWLP
ncbi:MAG: hypothetical protein HW403_938 [Dehalococcoidia bacterium]|nr:hypothetical protein [Dehalococcoidia bacterium]